MEGYYIILITKRKVVAVLGGHYIYHIDDIMMAEVSPQGKLETSFDEARYLQLFDFIDILIY